MNALDTRPTRKTPVRGPALLIGLGIAAGVQAQGVSIANQPLFLLPNVPANVMVMLDNSGSMQNVVPDTPYDPTVTYGCGTGSTVISTSDTIDIRIRTSSDPSSYRYVPYFVYGGVTRDWGTGSGTGGTGISKACFNPSANYSAKLNADAGSSPLSTSSYLGAIYSGNYLNWYFGYNIATSTYGTQSYSFGAGSRVKPGVKSRMEVAKTAGSSLIDVLDSSLRVGLSTYNSGNGGVLLERVDPLTTNKRNALKSQISALSATGTTPLAETLADIGWYFSQGASNLTLHPGTNNAQTVSRANVFATNPGVNNYTRSSTWNNHPDPLQYSCQASFAVLMTDGRPQSDRTISSHLRNYSGDCTAASDTCDESPNTNNLPGGPLPNNGYGNGTKQGRSYESQGSDYIDDVAMGLFDMDLRPDLVDPIGRKNNLRTYVVGFAEQALVNDPLLQDTVTRAGGQYFTAGNEEELTTAFQDVVNAITQDLEDSNTSVAASTAILQSDTLLYVAGFRSTDWSGELKAYSLDANGRQNQLSWDAEAQMRAAGVNGRNLFTRQSVSGNAVTFSQLSNLSAAQQTALGISTAGTADGLATARFNWLKGTENNNLRSRQNPISGQRLLGDIVNSNPLFVGKRNFGNRILPENEGGSTYDAFRASTTYRNRPDTLYVGSNDGFLHAFNASNGNELFAYMPSELLLPSGSGTHARINELMNTDYEHKYFVDGTPTVGDAYWSGSWKTVLVGTMGAGGRTVFGLDVTNPSSFGTGNALWEFGYADVACTPGVKACREIGYGIGQPAIARVRTASNTYEWAAIFGNGYNSAGHKAQLFVVRLSNGELIRTIDTGVGSAAASNGLASPVATDWPVFDLTTTTVYAGDLYGNMWRFDLSAQNTNQWDATSLFQARDNANAPQPITARPLLAAHPTQPSKIVVTFGTGSYFRPSDAIITTPQVQSLYGLFDTGSTTVSGRNQLTQQTITWQGTASFSSAEGSISLESREISRNVVSTTSSGWYLDLAYNGAALGERVISAATLPSGINPSRVRFTSLIPDSNICSVGRRGYIFDVDLTSGGGALNNVFDLNRDGLFTSADLYQGRVLSAIGGSRGVQLTTLRDSDSNIEFLYAGGAGEADPERGRGESEALDRKSWRELR